jgi:hypothetical protein
VATARYHARINRSADDVWKVVSDAASISEWFPGITASTADATTRTITLDGGMDLNEEIVTNDPALRRFQYRIVGGAMPVEFHLGTVDVIEDGAGSLVIYSTDIRPDDFIGLVGPATEGGLGGLKAKLES